MSCISPQNPEFNSMLTVMYDLALPSNY